MAIGDIIGLMMGEGLDKRITIDMLREADKAGDVAYLGDGAYAFYKEGDVWVVTSNGIQVTNEVCLGSRETKNLISYCKARGVGQ